MQQVEYTNFEDIKIIDQEAIPQLTTSLESALVNYINDCWSRSEQARRNVNSINLEKMWEKIDKADRCEHNESTKKLPDYRSKIYLPWIRQALVSTTAYLAAMLLGGQWFGFTGWTPEDTTNAEYMTKRINFLFKNNYDFRKVIIQSLYQFNKAGQTCIKGFWQYIKSFDYMYEEQQDETGNTVFVKKKQDRILYNDPRIEFVNIKDFHFYPVNKPLEFCTQIYRYYMKYSDLKENQNNRFINIDKINKKTAGNTFEETDIEIKEAWISECYVDGQKLNNIIVSIAQGKVVEFKTNVHDYGLSPFAWSCFEYIEGYNLGRGLCFDSVEIQDAANLMFNMIMDGKKVATHPMYQGPDDLPLGLVTSRPGGYIPIPKEAYKNNVRVEPVQYNLQGIEQAFNTLFQLKREFEAATVPEFIKGVRPENNETATRDVLVQQGAENKLTVAGDNFNEEILKPVLRLIYCLFRQRMQVDPDARLKTAKICLDHTEEVDIVVAQDPSTGEPITDKVKIEKPDEEILQEFPEILPLEKIDICIDGYKTNVKKQQTMQNIRALLVDVKNAGLDPDVMMKIDQESLLREAILNSDLDSDKILFSDDEAMDNQIKKFQTLFTLQSYQALIGGGLPNAQQPNIPAA